MEAIIAIVITLITASLIGAYIAIRVAATEDEEMKDGEANNEQGQ